VGDPFSLLAEIVTKVIEWLLRIREDSLFVVFGQSFKHAYEFFAYVNYVWIVFSSDVALTTLLSKSVSAHLNIQISLHLTPVSFSTCRKVAMH